MRRPAWLLLVVALAGGCRTAPGEGDQAPPAGSLRADRSGDEGEAGSPGVPGALPDGFRVLGEPSVEIATLPPAAMWRFLVSRLTTLRADARAAGSDLLVTFDEDAVHVTERSGGRLTWRLPAGLRLVGAPRHLLLGADLRTRVYGPDGAQVEPSEEVTVIDARFGPEGDPASNSRLVIKGGHTFRSISTTG